MRNINDNEIFGRWRVLSAAHKNYGHQYYLCQCECGKQKKISGHSLLDGFSKSCGCLQKEIASQCNTKHKDTLTKEYKSWSGMKSRCYIKKNAQFKNYGARGIRVCDRWINDYPAFLQDMGRQPGKGYSIERKDVNGNYCPENCKWATAKDQANNKTDNVFVTYKGETKTFTEWCEYLGINIKTAFTRRHLGWPIEKIFGCPVNSLSLSNSVTYNGVTRTVVEWAKLLGVTSQLINKRLRSGWTVKDAIEAPKRKGDRRFWRSKFPVSTTLIMTAAIAGVLISK